MKICDQHWGKLQGEIVHHGLNGLVSKDGATAIKRTETAKTTGLTVANFDPLIYAHSRLIEQLVYVGGSGIFVYEGCPVCLANRVHKERCVTRGCTFSYDSWIETAADEAKKAWEILQQCARKGTT